MRFNESTEQIFTINIIVNTCLNRLYCFSEVVRILPSTVPSTNTTCQKENIYLFKENIYFFTAYYTMKEDYK